MKEGKIILILSLIIFLLLGYMIGSIFSKSTEEFTKKHTKEECIELAFESNEGYKDCMKTGLVELYGYDYGIDCINDFDANAGVCRGTRFIIETQLSNSCYESFPSSFDILPNCLAGIEGFNTIDPDLLYIDYG